MPNPSFMYDEGGNAIGVSADRQPPLVIPPSMKNLPNAPSAPAQAPLVMPKGQLPTQGQTIPGQSNAPLNVPKSLQNALQTAPATGKASVIPPKNNVVKPAAPAQPQASGVPTAQDLIAHPETAYAALSKQGVGALGNERETLLELLLFRRLDLKRTVLLSREECLWLLHHSAN